MDDRQPDPNDQPQSLFKKFPKLGVLIVAGVFYAILLAMLVVIAVLIFGG